MEKPSHSPRDPRHSPFYISDETIEALGHYDVSQENIKADFQHLRKSNPALAEHLLRTVLNGPLGSIVEYRNFISGTMYALRCLEYQHYENAWRDLLTNDADGEVRPPSSEPDDDPPIDELSQDPPEK